MITMTGNMRRADIKARAVKWYGKAVYNRSIGDYDKARFAYERVMGWCSLLGRTPAAREWHFRSITMA